jgi:hypothetical protein
MKRKAEVRLSPPIHLLRSARDPVHQRGTGRGPIIGRIVAADPGKFPVVEFQVGRKSGRFAARSTVPVTLEDAGREVVLLFERNVIDSPIIVGVIQPVIAPKATRIEAKELPSTLVLEAQEEIKLSCGKATMFLTRAGKILLKGTYVLSRSSGVNRIKGGSVQIN